MLTNIITNIKHYILLGKKHNQNSLRSIFKCWPCLCQSYNNACHMLILLLSVSAVINFLLAHATEVASRRPHANHVFTNGSGLHKDSGGPTRPTNIKDAICCTDRLLRNGEHIIFSLLKPRSHSAVLTGRVSTALINCFITSPIMCPIESLKSR
jgi:hypothetical protein